MAAVDFVKNKMSAQGVKGILRISLTSNPKNNVIPTSQVLIPQASLSTSDVSQGAPQRESKMGKEAANLANMKRGTGYRSSFSGSVATIFGGK